MITFHAHHGDAKLSKIIRWMSPKYNHVSIQIGRYVYEAHIEHGVTKTYYPKWKGKKTVVDSIFFQTDRTLDVLDFLEKQVGKKYDVLGIFSFLWWFFKPQKGKWYCSELAQVALYKAIGMKSTDYDYNQKVSPYQFWRGLQALQKTRNVL